MARPLTILLVAPRLDATYPLTYTENLARGLGARHHAVTLISSGGLGIGRLRQAGIQVHDVPPWSASLWDGDAIAVGKALRIVRQPAPDIIHAVSQRTCRTAARLARALGVPYVCTVHALPRNPRALPITRRCGGFLAISEWMRQSLVNEMHVGKDLIHIVPYGVDSSRYRHTGKERLSPWIPVIGTYGRLDGNKGVEFLLDAVKLLRDAGHDPEVLVTGEGPLKVKAKLIQQAAALGLRRRVTFVGGFVPSVETIPNLDIYVQPNVAEGLGIELIEAMACGRPVVASAVGGIQEVVHDGSTGLLVRPRDPVALADRIQRLLTDEPLCLELGRGARDMAEQAYGLEAMIDATELAYQAARVLAGTVSPASTAA